VSKRNQFYFGTRAVVVVGAVAAGATVVVTVESKLRAFCSVIDDCGNKLLDKSRPGRGLQVGGRE
jgi:hypothetical protein